METGVDGDPASPTVPAGWHPDPQREHELRYWDGSNWTAFVADTGQQSVDPLVPAASASAVTFSASSSGAGSKSGYRPHMTPDLMEASFSFRNGWDQRSILLEAGQRARFRFESQLETGSIAVDVKAPDGAIVLHMEGAVDEEDTLVAASAGKYTVRVGVDNGSGRFRLLLIGC